MERSTPTVVVSSILRQEVAFGKDGTRCLQCQAPDQPFSNMVCLIYSLYFLSQVKGKFCRFVPGPFVENVDAYRR